MNSPSEPDLHDAAETIAGGSPFTEGPGARKRVRTAIIASVAMTVAVLAFLFGYAGAFADPTPRDLPIGLVGPDTVAAQLEQGSTFDVHRAADAAQARRDVLDRETYGAVLVDGSGAVEVFIATGAGRSAVPVVEAAAAGIADATGQDLTTTELVPTSSRNPAGSVEFYCIIFLAIGASLGATVFGRILGTIGNRWDIRLRIVFVVFHTLLLSLAIAFAADVVLGALPGHFIGLTLSLWAFGLATCLALTGVGAFAGTVPGLLATVAFVILGNSSAGGPVVRELLPPFTAALTPVLPHGSGMSLVRGNLYFDGRGVSDDLLRLGLWALLGVVLLVAAAIRFRRDLARADAAQP